VSGLVRQGADGAPDGLRGYRQSAARALERGQRSRPKVVRRPTYNIDYPLKLPRCEFGHNLLKGAGLELSRLMLK